MKPLYFFIALLVFFFVSPIYLSADNHSKVPSKASADSSIVTKGTNTSNIEDLSFFELLLSDYDQMNNLHPFIVHFPIAFIIIAFPIFLIGLKTDKKDVKTTGLLIFILGFLGVLSAAYFFVPHPDVVTGQVKEVLEFHTLFGKITLALAAITTLLCFVYFKLSAVAKYQPTELPKKFEKPIALGMFITLIIILVTGHLGGSLTHVYKIKTKGVHIDFSTPIKSPTSTPW